MTITNQVQSQFHWQIDIQVYSQTACQIDSEVRQTWVTVGNRVYGRIERSLLS